MGVKQKWRFPGMGDFMTPVNNFKMRNYCKGIYFMELFSKGSFKQCSPVEGLFVRKRKIKTQKLGDW